MSETKNVVQELQDIKTYLASQAVEAIKGGNELAREGFIESQIAIDKAIALLKEQEPRVLTLEEALADNNNSIEISPYVFVEVKGRNDIFIGSVHDDIYGGYHSNDIKVRVYRIWMSDSKTYPKADYMKTVRFWNRKPTYEQRQAVTWND